MRTDALLVPPIPYVKLRIPQIWFILLVLSALVNEVESLALRLLGDVQQCATLTLELTGGSSPYMIFVIAPPDGNIQRMHQRDPRLVFQVVATAGTELQVVAQDSSGEVAQLSTIVERSDDDSCLDASGTPGLPSFTVTNTISHIDTTSVSTFGSSTRSDAASSTAPTFIPSSTFTSIVAPSQSPHTSTPSPRQSPQISTVAYTSTMPAVPVSHTPVPSSTLAPPGGKSGLSAAAVTGISASVAVIVIVLLASLYRGQFHRRVIRCRTTRYVLRRHEGTQFCAIERDRPTHVLVTYSTALRNALLVFLSDNSRGTDEAASTINSDILRRC